MRRIQKKRWMERHVHFRKKKKMMADVIPATLAQHARGAVIMPNLLNDDGTPDPVDTPEKAHIYREQVLEFVPKGSDFKPFMTCYLTDRTTPEEIERGWKEGAWEGAKLYMADTKGEGGTTGSAHGVRDLVGRYPVFRKMQEIGMPLLGHLEACEGEVDEFDREMVSLERDLKPLRATFPDLTIVVEHVSTAEMADFVDSAPGRTFATVTPMHIRFSRNMLFKGGLCPLAWFKPILKRERHRVRVRSYVTQGHQRFGAGTDSAPHPESSKAKCCGCAAGAFTASHAAEWYWMSFVEDGREENFDAFMAENFLDVYGLQPSDETMEFVEEEWTVPLKVGDVPVFGGSHVLPWKLV